MLYLVATPIGNLSDITLRAIETLKSCSLILCEDTRHSRKLTAHYQIATPLKSYHKFNEAKMEAFVMEKIAAGASIALISDAGTPAISDPGARLVLACQEKGLPVTAIPGPCAAITALTLSGLDTSRFQFIGFLPKKKGELKTLLLECCRYLGTTIAYESPHRLKEVLTLLKEIAPSRTLAVARELTKIHEEVKKGTAAELLHYFQKSEVKGEIVLMMAPGEEEFTWEELPLAEHVAQLIESEHLTKNEAIKKVAALRKIPKREVYNAML